MAWTQQVFGETGDATVKEHADAVQRMLDAGRASYVPRALLACAGAARHHFDGLDPDSQTLYHLYEVLFASFGQEYQIFPRADLVEVAEDLAVVSVLRTLATEDPARLLAGLPLGRLHPPDESGSF